jgi:multicomponent Na+:H+ antiporter subunit G
MLATLVGILMIVAGLVFFLGAAVGLIRFPDFYTRMHAAGKGDTLSTLLILSGIAVYFLHNGVDILNFLVALKILAICAFIALTSPTSTHALMKAGFDDGIEPVTDESDDEGGNITP